MIVDSESTAGKAPGTIYGAGLGRFLTLLIGEEHLLFATTFGAMAFSTFVFDTLDVSTRLGRYVIQELLGWTSRSGAVLATALTVLPPALFVATAGEGSYRVFWTLFGTSNQLLAALTLLAISVWLHRSGRRYWFTLLPMLFVMTITLWSLGIQAQTALTAIARTGLSIEPNTMNGIVSLLLLGLAGLLVVESGRALLQPARSGATGAR
jgi:carbon starvation protein